jgi:xanthine dehydrogenase accessory factor
VERGGFLFHDHDWEEALLPPALAQEALYHGAIGSQRTHAARLAMLERLACPPPYRPAARGGGADPGHA